MAALAVAVAAIIAFTKSLRCMDFLVVVRSSMVELDMDRPIGLSYFSVKFPVMEQLRFH
jgi:hypothetical protein